MKNLKIYLLGLMAGLGSMGAQAQIGYQIALLNTATGEARANETVTVSVSLSNKEGKVFYSETKSATTNDFGVLSLSIGNADTFKEVDLSKMPFFIEVKANDVLIGKSQMLSVPVAEVAKRVAPIDKSELVGTWKSIHDFPTYYYTFKDDGTGTIIKQYDYKDDGIQKIYYSFRYEIEGRNIYVYDKYEYYDDRNSSSDGWKPHYRYELSIFILTQKGRLFEDQYGYEYMKE